MNSPRFHRGTRSAIHLLHRASQCADDLFARVSNGFNLTARQYVVLSIIAESDDPSQTEICDASGIDRSTLADIVARLVERGLVSRQRTPEDGRKYAVKLTDEGRQCLEHATPVAERVEEMLLRNLSAEDRERLDAALSLLIAGSAAQDHKAG